jgi:hypothetical protein
MEVELKTENYFLKWGRTINLNLYTISALSLNCFESTHNCIINYLKIGLSLYRKKPIGISGKFHKPGNNNVNRLHYIAVLRRVPYFSSSQSEQIDSKATLSLKMFEFRMTGARYQAGLQHIWTLLSVLLLLLSSVSPLCRVSTLIFLRQTISLGNTVLQLFWCNYSWCVYR